MTYHAGLSGFGPADRDAHITCDGAHPTRRVCGVVHSVTKRSGAPFAWFLDGKAPPGWKLIRTEEPFTRRDYCPKCKAQVGK